MRLITLETKLQPYSTLEPDTPLVTYKDGKIHGYVASQRSDYSLMVGYESTLLDIITRFDIFNLNTGDRIIAIEFVHYTEIDWDNHILIKHPDEKREGYLSVWGNEYHMIFGARNRRKMEFDSDYDLFKTLTNHGVKFYEVN